MMPRLANPSGFSYTERILLYSIIALGLFSHIFNLIVLPESALADAPFHVLLGRQIAESGELFAPTFMRTAILQVAPLYYVLEASLAVMSSNFLQLLYVPFARLLPAIFTLLILMLSFLLFRRLFPRTWLLPFAFVAIFPWGIRYGAVNYPENLLAVLLLAALLLLLSYFSAGQWHGKGQSKAALLVALVPVLAALALVKSYTPIIAALLAFALAAVLFVHRGRKSALLFAALSLLMLSPFAMLWASAQQGSAQAASTLTEIYGERYAIPETSPLAYLFDSHASFYDFPPRESFARVPLLSGFSYWHVSLVFSLVMLPLTVLMLIGAFYVLSSRPTPFRSFWLLSLTLLAAVLAIALYTGREVGFIFMRPLVPFFTIFAALLGKGFEAASAAWLQGSAVQRKQAWAGASIKWPAARNAARLLAKLALVSLAVFSIYSLAYTSVSAQYYADVHSKHAQLYAQISNLPEDVKIHNAEIGRAIGLYTARKYDDLPGMWMQCIGVPAESCINPDNPEAVAEALRSNNFTHIAVSCYRSPWQQHEQTLRALERSGAISQIYSDSCASLYEIAR